MLFFFLSVSCEKLIDSFLSFIILLSSLKFEVIIKRPAPDDHQSKAIEIWVYFVTKKDKEKSFLVGECVYLIRYSLLVLNKINFKSSFPAIFRI